jgi:hypothetical protein
MPNRWIDAEKRTRRDGGLDGELQLVWWSGMTLAASKSASNPYNWVKPCMMDEQSVGLLLRSCPRAPPIEPGEPRRSCRTFVLYREESFSPERYQLPW